MVTAGAAILAVISNKERIDKLVFVQPIVYDVLLIVGIVFIILAPLVFAITRLSIPFNIQPQYDCLNVGSGQLEEIYLFCNQVLGEGIASIERVRQWYGKNHDIFYLIYERKRRSFKQTNTLVGFFAVFPVTQQAKRLLSKNQLKGTEFTADHIVARGHQPAAIYIGAVAARGFKAKERTLMALMGYVISLAVRKKILVYTRPISKDGLRLAKQYGFEPVVQKAPSDKTKSDEAQMIFVRDFSKTAQPLG